MRWVIVFLMGVILTGLSSAAIGNNCENSMVAYWQLENDYTNGYGVGYDGSGDSTFAAGKIGYAAQFELGSEKITVPSQGDLSLTAQNGLTLELWINRELFSSLSNAFLMKKGNYQIEYTANDNIVATVGGVSVSTTSALTTGSTAWHFVAVVWDASDSGQELKLYIDGELNHTAALTRVSPSGNALVIGEGFKGLIDEIAIYGNDLTGSKIASHYNLGLQAKDYCYAAGGGGSSSTNQTFFIDGCFDEALGVNLAPDTCSVGRDYYCSDIKQLYDTRNNVSGCSQGASSYTAGDAACCPSGMRCENDPDGDPLTSDGPVCVQRTEECSSYTSKSECETNSALWIGLDDGSFICACDIVDYTCNVYSEETTCNADVLGIGQGSQEALNICGKTIIINGESYLVPQESCQCEWDIPGDSNSECLFGYNLTQSIWGVGDPNGFRCLKDYSTGLCLAGFQEVNWTADATRIVGFVPGTSAFSAALNASGCFDANANRACGRPVLKMPGFGLFELGSSLALIGLFYFLRKGKKKRFDRYGL